MTTEFVYSASKKRRLLAIYLDFLFFSAAWGILEFSLSAQTLPGLARLTAFAILEVLVYRYLYPPGKHLLSIGVDGTVDAAIRSRESWVTMALAVFLVLDGSKQLVRWAEMPVQQPFFGLLPERNLQIAVNVLSGLLFILAGYGFFKLRSFGLWLTLALATAGIASAAFSWELWDSAAAEWVRIRREVQGRPVHDGEIAFMQRLVPEMLLAAYGAVLLAAIASAKRFGARAEAHSDSELADAT